VEEADSAGVAREFIPDYTRARAGGSMARNDTGPANDGSVYCVIDQGGWLKTDYRLLVT
jgi:hypothetical protein